MTAATEPRVLAMSPFPQLTSRKRSLTILDLMVVAAVSALSMATLRDSGPIGPAGGPLAMFLLVTGYVLWWLPGLAAPERRRWLDAIALPIYMTLSVAYVLAAFLTVFLAPLVAVLVVAVHGVIGVYLAFRP
jgi:hypothetical protein